MKIWWGISAAIWTAFAMQSAPVRETTVVIGGDTQGYLSPCGCTKPMQGGVRRMAGALASIRQSGPALFFFNGPLTGAIGRQQELKAETMAEALAAMRTSGVNLTAADTRLGVGVIESMHRLSGNKVLSGHAGDQFAVPGRVAGAFWVIGMSAEAPAIRKNLAVTSADFELRDLPPGRPVIVLFDGDRQGAARVARENSQIKLVVYRKSGQPSTPGDRVASALLVAPGEKGKWLQRLSWNGKTFTQKQTISLGPEIGSDERVDRIYARYLQRVTQEKLVEQMPRRQGEAFAGTVKCGTCHSKDLHVWERSSHARALETIEKIGHDRDPDCISCHVVGIDKTTGFLNRANTPHLADVGCESCHGPGAAHSMDPAAAPMGKIGPQSCMSCHIPAHSPNFSYDAYWLKIQHGVEKLGKSTP